MKLRKSAVFLIALVGILSTFGQGKKFVPSATMDKKVSTFKFCSSIEDYKSKSIDEKLNGRFSFRVESIEFEDNADKRNFHVQIVIVAEDGSKSVSKWKIKKSGKMGVLFSDVLKGKKKLWAMKFGKGFWESYNENNDSNIIDCITVDEYEKTTLWSKNKKKELEREKEESKPLLKSEMSSQMFIAELKSPPLTILADVKLDDFYNHCYERCRDTHWNIRITEYVDEMNFGKTFYGYVIKSSELGKRMIDIVKDGKEHRVMIRISHPKEEKYAGDIVSIDRFEIVK